MPESRDDLVDFLNRRLNAVLFPDACPTGLQVYGSRTVDSVVTAVSASRDLFQMAAEKKAAMIIVHHGLFWDGDSRVIDPLMRERLSLLFQHEMSLVAYHLPLDSHSTLGNNARIIAALGFEQDEDGFAHVGGQPVGRFGSVAEGMTPDEFAVRVTREVGPLHANYVNGPEKIRRIAVCSGGGPRYLKDAANRGCDAFVTGDLFEPVEMWSREIGIHVLAAGHYATEVFGVRALAELINAERECTARFMNLPTNA